MRTRRPTARRHVGSGLTRSSSSSSEEDDDAVTPLKLTTPTKSCLRPQSSCSSLDSESEIEAFEETQKSLRRAEDPRRVRFRDKTLDAVVTIPNLEDYGWRARRDCYWQPEPVRADGRSRVWLERAVLETGGRAVIPGESRRGLGLVCEPETRLARASKIQQTARAGCGCTRTARRRVGWRASRPTPVVGRRGTRSYALKN